MNNIVLVDQQVQIEVPAQSTVQRMNMLIANKKSTSRSTSYDCILNMQTTLPGKAVHVGKNVLLPGWSMSWQTAATMRANFSS